MLRAPDGSRESFVRRYILRAGALFAVFAAVLACLKFFEASPWARWQAANLRWNYASHILMLVVSGAAAFALRRSRADFGLTSQDPARDLKLGLLCGIPLALLPLLLAASFGKLSLQNRFAEFWLSTIVFQVVFVGFGEEFFFRGFLQSEWNRVFERRFQIGHVRFGGGLLVTALLFGVGHWLNPFNPLLDRFDLNGSALVSVTFSGLILGFSRELTGSLYAAVLIHVAANVYPTLFVISPAGGTGMFVGWGVAVAVLIFAAHSPVASNEDIPE